MEGFLEHSYLGISGLRWLIALGIVLGGTPLLLLIRRVLAVRLRRLAARTVTEVDDVFVDLIEKTRSWFFVLVMFRAATLVLLLPDRWDDRAHTVLVVGTMVQAGMWSASVVRYLVDRRFANHIIGAGPKSPQVTPIAQTLLRFFGLVAVWSVVMLAALSAFGIDITALVAGLGVGGIAVALAVQRILGDMLASISILVDKPFEPGEFIAVGGRSGTVRRIGIRSTILNSLGGEELVIANNDMLSNQIQNFTRMAERRVVFKLGVVYDTSQARLEALPGMLRAIVEAQEKVRFGRAVLSGLGDSSIDYEVVYTVLDRDYEVFAAIHQQILFEMIRQMRAAGHDFAFPTRTLHVIPPEPPVAAPPVAAPAA